MIGTNSMEVEGKNGVSKSDLSNLESYRVESNKRSSGDLDCLFPTELEMKDVENGRVV